MSDSASSQRRSDAREKQKQATRDHIYEAGIAEITEFGLYEARIEHIAKRAGVTRPTVYANFSTKDDFLREYRRRSHGDSVRRMTEAATDATGRDLAHRLIDVSFDLVEETHPRLRAEIFALLIRDPPKVDWETDAYYGYVLSQIGEAVKSGEFTSNIDAVDLARSILTSFYGLLSIDSDPLADRRRSAHILLTLILDGAQGGD